MNRFNIMYDKTDFFPPRRHNFRRQLYLFAQDEITELNLNARVKFNELFYTASLLVAIGLLLLFSRESQFEAFSQTVSATSDQSLAWSDLLKIVVSAGIISGALSSFLTYHFSIKKIKEEMNIKKTEDRKRLYARIKANLDRMVENRDFKLGSEATQKLEDTISDIDVILIPDYYLASHSVQKKWWKVRDSLKGNFVDFKIQVEEMDNLLADELSKI